MILIGCVVSTLGQSHLTILGLRICIFHLLPLSRRGAVDAFSSQSFVRGGCSVGSLSHVTRFLESRDEREHTVPYRTTVRVFLVTGVNNDSITAPSSHSSFSHWLTLRSLGRPDRSRREYRSQSDCPIPSLPLSLIQNPKVGESDTVTFRARDQRDQRNNP